MKEDMFGRFGRSETETANAVFDRNASIYPSDSFGSEVVV